MTAGSRGASFGRPEVFRDHENLRFSDDSEPTHARIGARRETVEYEGNDPTAGGHGWTVRTTESEAGGTRFEIAGIGPAD